MASTSGCQLAYTIQNVENAKSNSAGDSTDKSSLLGSRVPRSGFNRSQSFANLNSARRNLNELVRCESYANRGAAYQSFDGFMSRHYLQSNAKSRFLKSQPTNADISLKRIQSCPNLSEPQSEVEYEIKCQDGECDVTHISECTHEECIADGHRNYENQMPSRRITGLFARSASITQALTSNGRFVSTSILQAARPAFRYSFVNGFAGIIMAFFLAAAGVLTALKSIHNHRFSGSKDCHKCLGEGAEECHICQGKGGVVWEGKLFHFDPCPACFGTGLVKCGHCKPRKSSKGLPYVPAGLGLGIQRA